MNSIYSGVCIIWEINDAAIRNFYGQLIFFVNVFIACNFSQNPKDYMSCSWKYNLKIFPNILCEHFSQHATILKIF